VADFADRRLPRDLRGRPPMWGFSHVPILYKDTVIVAPQTIDAGLVALDRATGRLRWRSPDVGSNRFSHVTSRLTTLAGVDQLVAIGIVDGGHNPPAIVTGIDAATGKLLWQKQTWKRYNCPIPTPLPTGDDRLFITGGYTIGCFSLKVTHGGGTWKAAYLFRDNNLVTAHIHTPIFYRGFIYAQSYDKFHQRKQNGLICLTPEGRLKWKTGPERDFGSGAILIADGLLFVMDGRTGELTLAEASPDGFKELAKAKVLTAKGRSVWAPMALSRGRLIVRDLDEMKCLDVREAGTR
jgi:hypothetical protein